MKLDKRNQQIVKNITVKKKVESHSERVAANFNDDDLVAQDMDRNAAIQ